MPEELQEEVRLAGTKIQEQNLRRGRKLAERGQITDAMFAARAGDPAGLKLLAERAGPGLRSIAQRLLTQSEVKLSAAQLARMALAQFVEDDDLDFQSRDDLFAFAEEASARLIDRIATEGSALPADSAAFKSLRAVFRSEETQQHPIVLSQALKVVAALHAGYGRLLHLRHVLRLDAAKSAQWLAIDESEILLPWERAQNLLLRASVFVAELGLAATDSDSLDASQQAAYSDPDSFSTLSLQALSQDSEPAADLAALRAENTALRERLKKAEERIAELESGREALDASITEETRDKIGTAVWSPLDDVPLYAGITDAEQVFEHLRTHYSHLLSHFGADRDYTSRPAIKAHDPNFITKAEQAISIKRREEREELGEARTPTLGMIMPKESDVGDQALASTTVEALFDAKNQKLAVLTYGRLRRHLYGK